MVNTVEVIKLSNIEGFARKSGTDAQGNAWIEFEVDAFASDCECEGEECNPDDCPRLGFDCEICGERNSSGWLCLDGGSEVCDSHIEYDNV